MRHKTTIQTVAVALALALVATSTMGGAFAATGTNTNPAAPTGSSTVVVDGVTVEDFSAKASNYTYAKYTFDGNLTGQAAFNITGAGGEELYLNTSATETNATTFTYEWNISNDEFAELPIDAGQNKSFTFHVYDTQDKANATSGTIYFNNTDARTVVRVGETEAESDNASIEAKHKFLGEYLDRFDTKKASYDTSTALPNETLTIYFANDTFAQSYADAAGEDADAGAYLPALSFTVENADGKAVYVPVFNSEKTSEWDFMGSDQAYGVYNNDTDSMTVHNLNTDEDFEDYSVTESIDVSTLSNDKIGFFDAFGMFESLGASQTDAVTKAVGAAI